MFNFMDELHFEFYFITERAVASQEGYPSTEGWQGMNFH